MLSPHSWTLQEQIHDLPEPNLRVFGHPTHVDSTLLPVSLESPNNQTKEGAAAMKNQATQYLALDVHQATVVASLRSEDGTVRMRATVPTEAAAVVSLVRGAGPRVRVALEEGTQAQWLHDLIVP